MLTRYAAEWKALALVLGGGALLEAAPAHRLDLQVMATAAMLGGLVWRPNLGAPLIGFSLPFFFFSRSVGPIPFSPPGLLLVLTWGGVIGRRVRSAPRAGRFRVDWPNTGYDGPVCLFVAAALLTMLVTEFPVLSARELRSLVLEPVLFLLLLTSLARTGAARWCLIGFLLGAGVSASVAIVQVAINGGGTAAEGVLRAQAWYPSPNHLALMLGRALPFPVAYLLVANSGASFRTDRRPRALALGLALLIGIAQLLTFSLGGWLGAVASIIVVIGFSRGRRLATWIGGLSLVVLLIIGALGVTGRAPERLNPFRQTTGFRIDLWTSSLQMLRDHALLGVGMDNFVYLYQHVYLLQGAAAEPDLSHPHNWILHFWLELGILGLLAFVWLVTRFWRQVLRHTAELGRSWVLAGAAGSVTALLVHGLIDNSYFLVDLAFTFWLALALVRPTALGTRHGGSFGSLG